MSSTSILRGAVKHFASVISAHSNQLLILPATSTKTATLFNPGLCNPSLHTSSSSNANKSHSSDRDSVRQKGIDVTPDASQQISFNNAGRSFGNVQFPSGETFLQSFNGVPFNQIPVVHIKATSNNTIVSVAGGDGNTLAIQSGGTVGFRNARKGTNVAAQAAAIALADDALRKEIKQVRVCVRGIGPGRFPALKAIEMSGIKIVSITDTTRLPHSGNRPKKVRRL